MNLINDDNEIKVGQKLSELGSSIYPDKAFAKRLLSALPVVTPVSGTRSTQRAPMAPWLRVVLLTPVALALVLFAQVEKMNVDPITDVYALEVEIGEIEEELALEYETLDAEAETEMDFVDMETFDEENITE